MNDVINKIRSVFERDMLLNFLAQLEEFNHSVTGDVKNHIFVNSPFHTADSMIAYLGHDLESKDSESIKRKLIELRNALVKVPIVYLTIPLEVDERMKDFIAQKSLEIAGKKLFFDITVNPNLLGGAIVGGNGRIGKYTMREYFTQRMEKEVPSGL